MSARPGTTAEHWARFQRDQEAYRRISLARRTHARFRRDLARPDLLTRLEARRPIEVGVEQ